MKLGSLNIAVVSVAAYMTHFFHPLDLTVNREAKRFMKDTFTTWYSDEEKKQIGSGNSSTDDIDVDLRLSRSEATACHLSGGPVQPSKCERKRTSRNYQTQRLPSPP